ncbi:hypothetical protein TPHV1_320007 [Treponema phagedenis]|uniref:Uncharacterized protein n=1 Tax=Treponema phagedenis TaxID=162 RepID=A0A0B7GUR9_TREPH|nr:hypothetical protein TPHV1_320007 [Treponema phagedenis]
MVPIFRLRFFYTTRTENGSENFTYEELRIQYARDKQNFLI